MINRATVTLKQIFLMTFKGCRWQAKKRLCAAAVVVLPLFQGVMAADFLFCDDDG
jgi:hypothetical protein